MDATAVGEILYRFEQETPWMPKEHSMAEAISFGDRMIGYGWVTVASLTDTGEVVGFVGQDIEELCSLYVLPEYRGRQIGKAMLDRAKSAASHLYLWTFQANTGAQRFYLREGFTEVGRSDGDRNSEGLPDIEYHWHADARAETAETTEPSR
nr:GNAT family N-acetyltransferase [Phaeobacter sp. HF9A]